MEDYEALLENLLTEYGEGMGEQKRLKSEAVIMLSTVVGATGEIPSVNTVLLRGDALDEIQKKCITEFWEKRAQNVKAEETIANLKEMIGALRKMEKKMMTAPKDVGVEEGKGGKGGGSRRKDLDFKKIGHLKDSKFGGKDGGAGWTNFVEDLRVVLGSVDKSLEQGVSDVMDLKSKELDDMKEVREHVEALEEGTWKIYSGELFARLMEITKDDAQKLGRGEGVKSRRDGFG